MEWDSWPINMFCGGQCCIIEPHHLRISLSALKFAVIVCKSRPTRVRVTISATFRQIVSQLEILH